MTYFVEVLGHHTTFSFASTATRKRKQPEQRDASCDSLTATTKQTSAVTPPAKLRPFLLLVMSSVEQKLLGIQH